MRGDVSSLSRRLLAALITIDVHSRDIVSSLLSKGTSSTQDFEWQMQLRYYWEEDDLVVRQVRHGDLYRAATIMLGQQKRICWAMSKIRWHCISATCSACSLQSADLHRFESNNKVSCEPVHPAVRPQLCYCRSRPTSCMPMR